jgi:hypothetical protein
MILKLTIILLSLTLGSCGGDDNKKKPKQSTDQLALTNRAIGTLRPFQVINQLLTSRTMAKDAKFDISRYIEQEDKLAFFYDFDASLKKLLGTYNGKGLTSEYVGA